MKDIYVLGVDVGGSHIACQLINLNNFQPLNDTYVEVKVSEKETAEVIFSADLIIILPNYRFFCGPKDE